LKKLLCKNLNLFYFTMWFLIIFQIILGYTLARCPGNLRLGSYCPKRGERCSYNSCRCYGKYQVKRSYYCAPWRRWKRVGKLQKCPPCLKKCGCTRKKNPVCATNGRTYANKCQLSCNRGRIACNGSCPCKNSSCMAKCRRYTRMLYCATNGITYYNSCSMRCVNARYKCRGKCPCRRIRFRPIKFRPYRIRKKRMRTWRRTWG